MQLIYNFQMMNKHYVYSQDADICELETQRLAETGKVSPGYEDKIIDNIVYYLPAFATFEAPPEPSGDKYPYRKNGKWVMNEDKRTTEEKEICEQGQAGQ